MSNLIFIRGYEIDIPKTMLQHHITDVLDLEKHIKKLIKKRTNSFRLLVIRNNAPNINDQYKMYIANKYLVKEKNNKEFIQNERHDYKQFFVLKGGNSYNGKPYYYGRVKQFVEKVEENKQHIIIKNDVYSMFYDLYEEYYAF